MIVLSKIKNFVTRIRKNKEIATATETMNKKVNDILVNGNAAPFSSVDIDYKENDDINDTLEENVEVETLSFEEAYITDEFPMNEAREMVKERDKKVLSELLYLPETVKKHDTNGNRALLAICAIPSVAYMSFVATSVIALPPVAMGVIGFGIAGGLVSGINKITGKNSTLGSLYRKVKVRFGHAKPKVDLKEYKYDFDKEKSAKNAILSKHINDFSSKKKTLNDLDKNLDKHFNDIVTTGVSSFSLNDRISQDILDNITNLISEVQPKLVQKQEEINLLATEKKELESYIEECEENQKLNALREDSTNTAIELAFNEILNNFKESLNKKEELSELVNTQNQRKNNIEIERDEKIQEQSQHIAELDGRISTLEDGDYKDDQLKQLEKEKVRLLDLEEKYATLLQEDELLKIQETDDFFSALNEDVKYFINNEEQDCASYIEDKLNNALKNNSLLDKVSHLIETTKEDGTIEKLDVNDYIFDKPLIIQEMLGDIIANRDKELSEVTHYSFYKDSFEKHNADMIKLINVNLLLNIENSQNRITEIINEGTKCTEEWNKIKNEFDEEYSKQKSQLLTRVQQLANESETEANKLKDSINQDFEQFKANQMNRLKEELYNNPTL